MKRISFVTDDLRVQERHPPVPALQCAPDWFRGTRTFMEPRRFPNLRLRADVTVKGCPGVVDYLGLGFIIPLWSDYLITATDEGFGWDSPFQCEGNLATFSPEQWPHFPRVENDHNYVLKMTVPWKVQTPRGWSILVMQPWYQRETRFTVMPGVVETDRFGNMSLIAVWHLPKGETALLREGTPLLHVVPIPRKRLVLSAVCSPERWSVIAQQAQSVQRRIAPGSYREDGRRRERASGKLSR